MEISEKIDNSRIREESDKSCIPIVGLLLKKLKIVSQIHKTNCTLFAVCPNSENVLTAAIRSAKRANAPIMFAATLNQVDADGGYTGWTQKDLIRKIKEISYGIGFDGPIITAMDHGGPWLKDIQAIERWNLDKCMSWIKKSFEDAIAAGYDLIHIDPTVDIFNEQIEIETVVNRTIELISHIENFRKTKRIGPISYEVGTEEVHGGLADISVFNKFLLLMKKGLKLKGLDNIWPIFIVGKVGTDLYTTLFDINIAKKLVDITFGCAQTYQGHYSDFVSNPEDYPKSGMGAANVGPEFTMIEYDALAELAQIEDELYKKNKVGKKSNFKNVLEKAIVKSNRWKKWLRNDEKNLNSLSTEKKELIIKTCSRYVWAQPKVKLSQYELYKNLEQNGIDPQNWVLMKIEAGMDKYFRSFNLIDLNEKLKIY
ncbi:MAG: class II D-tagatose-bisphosphate aldolase, non-catalytic subunit [Actinobacteria bacterium]|nr:class II D-tagatose-bisphosphate aldolase, non-catalytic subunit [Actinomycetota bacterium]